MMARPERMDFLRRPLYLVMPLALLVLALWGFWPRALPVETAIVSRNPLTVSFVEEGRTRLRQSYIVSAPLDGIVERIALDPGDPVTSGATVAMLAPARAALFDPANRALAEVRWRTAQVDLTAARALVTAARAERERSLAEKARTAALLARQLIAQSAVDAAVAQAAAAEAELQAAQARERSAAIERQGARAVLDLQGAADNGDSRLALRAPATGLVIRRHIESEQPVRAGERLLEIGDPADLEVVVEVLTTDAVRIAPKGEVRLTGWGRPRPLAGLVRVIEPGGFTKVSALGVEEQRVLVVVALLAQPAARHGLGAGFRVDAQFIVWHSPSVMTVPTAALFRDGPHWAVYAVEGGKARLRRVRLGQMSEDLAELVSGIPEGATVVLYPGDTVRAGSRVKRSSN